MRLSLTIIRKSKTFFIKYKLHRIVEPFSGFLLNLAYLSKLSKFLNTQQLKFNDFYSPEWGYNKRYKLFEHLIESQNLGNAKICYLEFGVSQGHSFKWFLEQNKHHDSRFYGFDTFEGLPEDWGPFKKGAMSVDGSVPEVNGDSRAFFIKGLFQDTLTQFISGKELEGRKIIMLDADLYSATLFVLSKLASILKSGDIIIFDQFTVPTHEFLAFNDFVRSHYVKLEMIAAANNYYCSAFIVK